MSQYEKYNVNISEGQKRKLRNALQVGGPVSIRLGHEDFDGDDVIALTNSQVNKIRKAYEGGKGVTIKMSNAQLDHNMKVEGGFLGLLARYAAKTVLPILTKTVLPILKKTILPAIATGAVTAAASSGVQKVMGKGNTGQGLYMKTGGCVCHVETDGEGLYLRPVSGSGFEQYGNGLYLKKGGRLYDGSGLWSHIPIFGPILDSLASLT